MVKVDGDPITNATAKEAKYSFFADAKTDVTNSMSDAVGLLPGYAIEAGSTVITASGEFAFRKSDGTWNWLED